MAVGGLITVIAVALGRANTGNAIAETVIAVGLGIGAVLVALGYIHEEAKIDREVAVAREHEGGMTNRANINAT